jgi:hypothetical protein
MTSSNALSKALSVAVSLWATLTPTTATRSRSIASSAPISSNDYGYTTKCEAPLGPIREHWSYGACYDSAYAPCCGPAQNFTTCSGYGNDPLPDVWKNGVCSGFSVFDCCFEENGFVEWVYTDCPDNQVKIDYLWSYGVNGTCTGNYVSDCCETQYIYTDCPTYYEKKTNGEWVDGLCYGASELDCCKFDCRYGYCVDDDVIDRFVDDPDTTSSSSGGLGFVLWIIIVLALALCIVPCCCGCCSRCPCYDKIRRHPAVVRTRKVWTTVSNVASTVEKVTKSAANVTDVVSTLQGGDEEEQTTVAIVAVGSDSCDDSENVAGPVELGSPCEEEEE